MAKDQEPVSLHDLAAYRDSGKRIRDGLLVGSYARLSPLAIQVTSVISQSLVSSIIVPLPLSTMCGFVFAGHRSSSFSEAAQLQTAGVLQLRVSYSKPLQVPALHCGTVSLMHATKASSCNLLCPLREYVQVATMAWDVVARLYERQPELRFTLEDFKVVELGGLCHDLGHGPYSHAFEKLVRKHEPDTLWCAP